MAGWVQPWSGPASRVRRSLPAPQKKGVTCFNFGIRQEEDGFVSSATPFQLFPERRRLEDMAGPNYNIREPAPAALPGFAPAAGTVSSFRASGLTEGFPFEGWPGALCPCAADGPAQSLAQDGGLCPRQGLPILGTGRGSSCRTAVSGLRCDGEQKRRAVPQAPLGTVSQATLVLRASAAPIRRR